MGSTPGAMPDPVSRAPTLGLVVQTRNEAQRLPGFLDGHPGFDGVLVVDMSSDDGTPDLARARNVPVLTVPHTGVCETHRQYALDHAPYDWVLVLDADERLATGGVEKLRAAIAGASDEVAAFDLRRVTYFGKVPLRGSGYGHEALPRLVRPARTRWPQRVHARPEFDGALDTRLAIAGDPVIDHTGFDDVSALVRKIDAYSTREADERLEPGSGDARHDWTRRLASELNHELRTRFTPEHDGPLAIWMTWMMMTYRVMTWAKLWERDPAAFPPARPDWFPRLLAGLFEGEHLHRAFDAAVGLSPSPAQLARETEVRALALAEERNALTRERDALARDLERAREDHREERARREALESMVSYKVLLRAKRMWDRAPLLKGAAKRVLKRFV